MGIYMKKTQRLKTGRPYPLGVTITQQGINFAIAMNNVEECGIVLYTRNTGKERRIPFTRENRIGNIYCAFLDEVNPDAYDYNYYCDDKIIIDPYAKKLVGHEKWGKLILNENKNQVRASFESNTFDWQKDKMPRIPYEESIFYCMHVRGFTRHSSSKVTGKGTFRGIMEKIPYLQDLGVTTLEILPAYEFDELVVEENKSSMPYMMEHYKENLELQKEENKINYWGFKKGYYFTPKASYAADSNAADKELKELIKTLHENQMELIMQFYFPKTVKPGFILEVLRFWVLEYHIDGIHLFGEELPITLIATDPLFSNTKLMYYDFPCDKIYEETEVPAYRNLASYEDKFMQTTRRYLKSDEDMLQAFLYHMKHNPAKMATVNYITNYYGFTLMDLVSYDYKHNEENGEENKDGTNYNYSWNCGLEGKTRKKSIQKLRMQQIKNALFFVLLAQGTPLIMSGDEFGNSQNGNNNAYCQDNSTSWLDWNLLQKNSEIYEYTKKLIQLRKEHPILRRKTECQLMDTLSCGYPDMSYHGEEVWRPVIDNYNRHIAIMYCGKYAEQETGEEDNFFYIAYNMHWLEHEFSLPNLPKGKKWNIILSTAGNENKQISETKVAVAPRSILVLISKA
ncbi:MAG: hypothetical protein PHS74_01945 [Lachnospiraceae bacterium]|nr:hypothetical protein [Lachnospiraceae bacterium]